MRLEETINQKKFRSEKHKLILNIMYTNNWVLDPIKHVLKDFKITMPQYNILRILKGSNPNPLSPAHIKSVMVHKKSDLTRMLDRLVAKDLIHREICPSNRRKMDITITKEGLKILDKIFPLIKEGTEDKISNNISEEEAKIINDLIDKMRG